MAFYRMRAGLPAEGASRTAAGTAAGRNLTGHIAGHHLSAVSLMYLATGDARFKQRADYLVQRAEARCRTRTATATSARSRAAARRSPPCLAVTSARRRSISTDSGRPGTRCTRLSPVCATRIVTPEIAPRSRSKSKFAAWAEQRARAARRRADCSRMLNTEHGGMNEVLADLYADTGDKRWLDLSYQLRAPRVHRRAQAASGQPRPASMATVRSRS